MDKYQLGKMPNQELLKKLNDLVASSPLLHNLPVVINSTISIGMYEIKKNNTFYDVSIIKPRHVIKRFYTRSGAIAFVKNKLGRQNLDKEIYDLDWRLSKNEGDVVFYLNTLQHSSTIADASTVRCRLDEANTNIDVAKRRLFDIILS